MFRPLLGHLHALWENRSKSYLYFNALWDQKCVQTVLYECEIHKFVYIGICVAVLRISHSYDTVCTHLGSHNALKYS